MPDTGGRGAVAPRPRPRNASTGMYERAHEELAVATEVLGELTTLQVSHLGRQGLLVVVPFGHPTVPDVRRLGLWLSDEYPIVPPVGAYVGPKGSLPNSHVYEAPVSSATPDLSAADLDWLCAEPEGWTARRVCVEGDHLLSFMIEVIRRLMGDEEFRSDRAEAF